MVGEGEEQKKMGGGEGAAYMKVVGVGRANAKSNSITWCLLLLPSLIMSFVDDEVPRNTEWRQALPKYLQTSRQVPCGIAVSPDWAG